MDRVAGQAVVVAAMALVADVPAALLALTVLLGTGVAIAQAAEFALVPAAAGEDRLVRANGLVEAARYAGMTAGPLAGGLLAGLGLVEAALLVDAATFVAVAAAAGALRARRHPRAARGPRRTPGGCATASPS